MTDTSRRDVLAGAAGLAAGSALSLPTPALAHAEPFRIESSAEYLELRRLTKLLAELERQRDPSGELPLDTWDRIKETWGGIQSLLEAMSAHTPRTPSDLLDYAAAMLFHNTSLYDGGLDPCEALNDAGERATVRDHSAFDLAWAGFALAGDRTTPARRAAWKPPMRDGPGTDI
jgi:hypothetical protein